MDRVDPPRVEEHPVPVLSDKELRAVLDAAKGKEFNDRRDLAILRLFIDTRIRLGEMAGLQHTDVDLDLQIAVVKGKGNRLRTMPFGTKTVEAIDRYLRVRRQHKGSKEPWLWLGRNGGLGDTGISQVVLRRGRRAGLARIHPPSVPALLRSPLAP